MGTIRIEFIPIQKYNLGLFGLDHLQLVYQDETDILDRQDYWFVLEGIQDGGLFGGTLGASGQDGHTSLGVANLASRDELVDKIGTPETRGSRIIATGPTAQSLWNSMAAYGGDIEDQKFPYIGAAWPFSPTPTINSTSLIASVLWSIGIDVNTVMPFGVRNSPGAATLLGTSGADDMQAKDNFTQIATGDGDDVLRGSSTLIWVEKLYGGAGDDTFYWSKGENIIHGGQPQMSYAADGLDTIDYTGVGHVHIIANKYSVEHKVATYVSEFNGGSDQLFSIEQLAWDPRNDTVTAGEGVDLLEKPLQLDLKGNNGGRGDEIGFFDTDAPLIVNVVSNSLVSVQAEANQGLDAGYWINSVEWLTGSSGNDRIYAGPTLLGINGADGDDLLDGRLSIPFSGGSPQGYDIELDGGRGDDTLVSGAGRTLAHGGLGADTFILSAMTSGNDTVEFVIDDASIDDRLYVPYDFFKLTRGEYEGSTLFQLTGGVFKIDDAILQSLFFWGPPDDNQVEGNIEFVGLIYYELEGSDLVITLMEGHQEVTTIDYGPGEPPGPTVTMSVGETDTTTKIRVHNWSEGVLGITFPLTWDNASSGNYETLADIPGWQSAVDKATAPDKFLDGLDARPDAHLPKEFGSGSTTARVLPAPVADGTALDDVIVATQGGPYHISGRGGDDDITGSDGSDILDGGTGADTMRGGRGNDEYHVDNAGDIVIEEARGGFDRVISSINYIAGTEIEHVALIGNALTAIGNALRNTLEGNDKNNTLTGLGGDDTLAGNGGNDTLIGGFGSDGYVYENGDGRDTIIEANGAGGGDDVLILAGNLKPVDVKFFRNPDAMSDLILRFTDGGSITIKNYFAAGGHTIEGVEFSTGTKWTAAQLSTKASAAVVTRNEAPVARDDAYTYAGSGAFTIPVAALLDNDTDANRDRLSITSITNVHGGRAVLDGSGHISITRGSVADKYVSFDYTVSDGHGGTSQASFDVSLVNNAAPRIATTSISRAIEDHVVTGRVAATDSDHDTLIYRVKAGAAPHKGTVTMHSDGTFTYTPKANANGADSFTLTVSDGLSAPVEKTFRINIAAVNDGPIAHDDRGFSVQTGERVTLSTGALTRNDTDVDRDHLSIVSVSGVHGGTVTRDAHGDVVFNARQGYSGPASFQYTVSDGHGGTSTATVSLTVKAAAAGGHLISGTTGNDTLLGTSGADTFVGKAGNDTFVFKPGSGRDVISDFEIGDYLHGAKDVLDLRGNGFTGYDDLLAHVHQSGADTLITVNAEMTIRLQGIDASKLFLDNFKIL